MTDAQTLERTIKVNVTVVLRPHQLAQYQAQKRFNVMAWHRRAGKTYYILSMMLARAISTNRKDYRAFYIAPTFKQAKGISWDYLKEFTQAIPNCKPNESELRIDLPNGARIQLLGAENYDAHRGKYADDITMDETAHIPSSAWTTVFSPMLADRKGRATFIGTPSGRHNLFWTLFDYAGGDDPEWHRNLLKYTDTDVLDPAEILRMRRTMRAEEFEQEMECSWNASMRGAFYGKAMAECEEAKRIGPIKYDKSLPVIAALDLGWSDAMVVGFWQHTGTEHRCLMAKAYHHTSIPDMVEDWRTLEFPIGTVVLPHDAKVHELGSGKTRQEIFHSLGCHTVIAPMQKIHEGIAAVLQLLPHCWFDKERTSMLREALLAYRSEFDEVKEVHRVTPVHDWSSHWADMVRYYALGRPLGDTWGPQGKFEGGY